MFGGIFFEGLRAGSSKSFFNKKINERSFLLCKNCVWSRTLRSIQDMCKYFQSGGFFSQEAFVYCSLNEHGKVVECEIMIELTIGSIRERGGNLLTASQNPYEICGSVGK